MLFLTFIVKDHNFMRKVTLQASIAVKRPFQLIYDVFFLMILNKDRKFLLAVRLVAFNALLKESNSCLQMAV